MRLNKLNLHLAHWIQMVHFLSIFCKHIIYTTDIYILVFYLIYTCGLIYSIKKDYSSLETTFSSIDLVPEKQEL